MGKDRENDPVDQGPQYGDPVSEDPPSLADPEHPGKQPVDDEQQPDR